MRPLRIVLALSTVAVLLAASPAEARRGGGGGGGGTRVALGLGADYLLDPEIGEFQLTLALETPIVRGLTAGVRFGGLITSDSDVGAPIDFRLRLRTHGIYVDGLIGPWLLFERHDVLDLHGAFGFGLLSGGTSIGLELGWLDGTGMLGLRLAFSL
jgi:hypothetical protein